MSDKVETGVLDEPKYEPTSTSRGGLRGVAFGVLAVVCLVVGIGAGIGAGYGIFHKDSTTASPSIETPAEEWLVVVSADNGTMAISPSGLTSFEVDGLRARAPAYTNYPERIATLATTDTAMDFIDEGISMDGGANVILTFKSGNVTFMAPVVVGEKLNATGDSATFLGVVDPDVLVEFNETGAFPFEDANMFILAGSAPSSLDFA